MAMAAQSPVTTSPAFESTLASYATRILRTKSPSTVSIDPSVGPYVTSVLRAALKDSSDSSADDPNGNGNAWLQSLVPEQYHDLMEFLMEQCEMNQDDASSALHSIAGAIRTGTFDEMPMFSFDNVGIGMGIGIGRGLSSRSRQGSVSSTASGFSNSYRRGGSMGLGFGMGIGGYNRKFRSKSMGAECDYGEEETIHFLGEMLSGKNAAAHMGISSMNMNYRRSGSVGSISIGSVGVGELHTVNSWSKNGNSNGHDRADEFEYESAAAGAKNTCIIEEEPSFFFEEDEVPEDTQTNSETRTPCKNFGRNSSPDIVQTPVEGTSCNTRGPGLETTETSVVPRGTEGGSGEKEMNSDFMLQGFSPFWTDEEKKVVEDLRNMPPPKFSFTPLKPDRLIPVDLLGVIDDPVTPSNDLAKAVSAGHSNFAMERNVNMGMQNQSTSTDKTGPDAASDGMDAVALSAPNIAKPSEANASPLVKSSGSSQRQREQSHPLDLSPAEVGTIPTKGGNDSKKAQDVQQSKTTSSTTTTAGSSLSSSTTTSSTSSTQTKPTGGKGKKNKKTKANDLAAALFTRPRSRSMQCYSEEKSPKLKPMAPPPVSQIGMSNLSCSAAAVMNNSIPVLFQKQLDSAVEILLAMNYDICREAAHEAALVSNADVNVAQHVIDGALLAPPVCRHMLNDGCYRSDCQFSHDVDGHTCLFWLRGRCGKGPSCRFMHGFSEKLLEGLNTDFRKNPQNDNVNGSNTRDDSGTMFVLPPAQSQPTSGTKPIAVKTANLVQHNMKTSFSLSSSMEKKSFLSPHNGSFVGSRSSTPVGTQNISDVENDTNSPLASSPALKSTNPSAADVPGPTPISQQQAKNASTSTFSFASIASKGYSQKKSFNNSAPILSGQSGIGKVLKESNEKKVTRRIPQDLWTSTHKRSSAAFHISDPIARYEEVSKSVQRDDVVDLHFQSVKTFPVVLASVLPNKLRHHREIWVVTGSGHHVNRSSHQKGGGVLETAVIGWLTSNEYSFVKGKDKNGYGGALLVQNAR